MNRNLFSVLSIPIGILISFSFYAYQQKSDVVNVEVLPSNINLVHHLHDNDDFKRKCSNWDCSEIEFEPLKDYNLEGLEGKVRELVKYRRDMEILEREEMIEFCRRYRDREIMLGQGTRKPVNVYIHNINDKRSKYLGIFQQLETIDQCSVPCIVSRGNFYEDEQDKDEIDVVVSFTPFREPFWIGHNKSRPFKALVSVENKYANPEKSLIELINKVDLLIHHYPYSDIPTFIMSLGRHQWLDEQLIKIDPLMKTHTGEEFKKNFMKIFYEEKSKNNILGVDFVSRGCSEEQLQEGVERDKYWYRREYLKIVQEEILTDNYGKCGSNKKKEPKFSRKQFVNKILVASKNYKFFFCFENSMSYNYVSEKLSHSLRSLYTVPVYFGAPNVMGFFNQEEEVIAEKGYKIFINVAEDFPNPYDLVEYLKYLDGNDTAYFEYFQWRFDGVDVLKQSDHFNWMRDSTVGSKGWICRLCEKIYYGENRCHHEEYPEKPFTVRVNLQ